MCSLRYKRHSSAMKAVMSLRWVYEDMHIALINIASKLRAALKVKREHILYFQRSRYDKGENCVVMWYLSVPSRYY